MASILNRYENIMSTNVCGMIEFAEDPMKMARHLSHHMEDDLSKTKREGAELIAEIEKLDFQYAKTAKKSLRTTNRFPMRKHF